MMDPPTTTPASVGGPRELNMNGYCFLCLRGDDNTAMVKSTAIKSFSDILCYLTGFKQPSACQTSFLHNNATATTDEGTDFLSVLKSIGNEPPLLCVDCYDSLAEINRLHLEQLEIQQKIKREATIVRKQVLSSTGNTKGGKSRREVFLKSFRKSNIPTDQCYAVTDIVFKVHERIIGKDATPGQVLIGSSGNPSQKEPVPDIKIEVDDADETTLPAPAVDLPPASSPTDAPTVVGTQPGAPTGSMNVCGVPVDPTASYVMITTNVTDPLTGAVTVQPVLINVAQLQQSQSQTPVVTPTTTHNALPPHSSGVPPPSAFPSGSHQDRQKRKAGVSGGKRQKRKSPPETHVELSKAHNFYHNELRIQSCDVCGEGIPLGPPGSSHLAVHVGHDYVHYCKQCEHSFCTSLRMFEFHRSRHLPCTPDPWKIFKCDLCTFEADTLVNLRKHLEIHNKDASLPKSYPCPLCQESSRSKKLSEMHLHAKHVRQAQHTGRQCCDVCKSLFSFNDIELHLREAHGIKEPLRCKACPNTCSNLDAMLAHQNRAKTAAATQYHERVCHLCDKVTKFLNHRTLREHYFQVHHLGSEFVCDFCNDEFSSRDRLNVHLDKLHNVIAPADPDNKKTPKKAKPKRMLLACPDCNCRFAPSQLLSHKIERHNHPRIKCSEPPCEDTFASLQEQKLHVAGVHRGFTVPTKEKRTITCEVCGLLFFDRLKYKSHWKVHSDLRPYKCDYPACQNSYKSRHALNLHVKFTHLKEPKERRHICDICNKGFFQEKSLKSHLLIHSGERPFACQHCGQRFRQQASMLTHEQGHALMGEEFKPKGEMERKK